MIKRNSLKLGGKFYFEYFENGKLIWKKESKNLVVNEGINHSLDVLFTGATQVNPWYILLLAGTPTVANTDTMSSHAGWTEVATYTESVRQTYVDVRTDQTVSNSVSVASFTFSASGTIGGAGLTSESTKSGTTGTLLSASAFSGDETFTTGGTLNVTYVFNGASS